MKVVSVTYATCCILLFRYTLRSHRRQSFRLGILSLIREQSFAHFVRTFVSVRTLRLALRTQIQSISLNCRRFAVQIVLKKREVHSISARTLRSRLVKQDICEAEFLNPPEA